MDEFTRDYNKILSEIKSSEHFKRKIDYEKTQALCFMDSQFYKDMLRVAWERLSGLEAITEPATIPLDSSKPALQVA